MLAHQWESERSSNRAEYVGEEEKGQIKLYLSWLCRSSFLSSGHIFSTSVVSAYKEVVSEMALWYMKNNLSLNSSKTQELIVDFRKQRKEHALIQCSRESQHPHHRGLDIVTNPVSWVCFFVYVLSWRVCPASWNAPCLVAGQCSQLGFLITRTCIPSAICTPGPDHHLSSL